MLRAVRKFFKYSIMAITMVIIGVIMLGNISLTFAAAPHHTVTLDKQRELKKLRDNPRIKAFLDVIAYAEGTFNERGYATVFTFKYFDNFCDHPQKEHCSVSRGGELCSDASGRYQIKAFVWKKLAERIGAKNFSPLNQDYAAIELLKEKKVIELILGGFFEQAILQTNKIWASFPGSPYGQPVKKMSELRDFYNQQLKKYKNKR